MTLNEKLKELCVRFFMIIIRPHRMHGVQRRGPFGSVYLLVIIVSPKTG